MAESDAVFVRKRFDELSSGRPPVDSPVMVRYLRRDLGITAFGAQILELPPDSRGFEHDHAEDGQEELYVGLEGSGWVEVEGERAEFGPSIAVCVRPTARRQAVAGPDGLTWLCIGAKPGAYEPPAPFA